MGLGWPRADALTVSIRLEEGSQLPEDGFLLPQE
jgi:hypothetical protein